MLHLPHTATAEISAVLPKADVLPSDIPSLIALHKTASEAADAAETDDDLNAAGDVARPLYAVLLEATGRNVREEVERLAYVADYCTRLGIKDELDGYFDLPDLAKVAKNLTKLAKPAGPDALKVISKNIQPMSQSPEPSLSAQLDRLERDGDLYGMIALYDYFVLLAKTNTAFSNAPRAADLVDFLIADSERFWAKAYAVADRLKKLKPTKTQREYHARALIDAAFAMGCNLNEVAVVVQHLREAHE